MAKRQKRNNKAYRESVQKDVNRNVLTDKDFNRMILEVSETEKIPIDVVEAVVKHFVSTLNKFLFLKKITTRVSCFGFINVTKKHVEKNINKN